jgi:hypothetical protein
VTGERRTDSPKEGLKTMRQLRQEQRMKSPQEQCDNGGTGPMRHSAMRTRATPPNVFSMETARFDISFVIPGAPGAFFLAVTRTERAARRAASLVRCVDSEGL